VLILKKMNAYFVVRSHEWEYRSCALVADAAAANKDLEWANLDFLLPSFSLYKTETFRLCFVLLYTTGGTNGGGRVPWFMCDLNYSSFVFAWTCCGGKHVIRHPDSTVVVSFDGHMKRDDGDDSLPRVGMFRVKNVRCSPPSPEALLNERRHKIVCLATSSYLGRAQRITTDDNGKDRVYEWRCSSSSTRPFSGVPLWRKEDGDLRLETHRDLVRLRVEPPHSARQVVEVVVATGDFVPDNDDFSNAAVSPLPIVCGGAGGCASVTLKFFNLGQADERAACSNAAEVNVRPKDFSATAPAASAAPAGAAESPQELLLTKPNSKRRSSLKPNAPPPPPKKEVEEDLVFSSRLTSDLTVEVHGTRCGGDGDGIAIVSVKLIAKNYHFALKFTPIHPPMSV
jgi:hypothetical protein